MKQATRSLMSKCAILIAFLLLLAFVNKIGERLTPLLALSEEFGSHSQHASEYKLPPFWAKPLTDDSMKYDWTVLCRHFYTTNADGRGGLLIRTVSPYFVLNLRKKTVPVFDRFVMLFVRPQPDGWLFLDDLADYQESSKVKPPSNQ